MKNLRQILYINKLLFYHGAHAPEKANVASPLLLCMVHRSLTYVSLWWQQVCRVYNMFNRVRGLLVATLARATGTSRKKLKFGSTEPPTDPAIQAIRHVASSSRKQRAWQYVAASILSQDSHCHYQPVIRYTIDISHGFYFFITLLPLPIVCLVIWNIPELGLHHPNKLSVARHRSCRRCGCLVTCMKHLDILSIKTLGLHVWSLARGIGPF